MRDHERATSNVDQRAIDLARCVSEDAQPCHLVRQETRLGGAIAGANADQYHQTRRGLQRPDDLAAHQHASREGALYHGPHQLPDVLLEVDPPGPDPAPLDSTAAGAGVSLFFSPLELSPVVASLELVAAAAPFAR